MVFVSIMPVRLIFKISIFMISVLLENGDLCKLREDADDAVVRLGTLEASSKVVTQYKYFASWTGRYNFKCSFQVKAPTDYGKCFFSYLNHLRFHINDNVFFFVVL